MQPTFNYFGEHLSNKVDSRAIMFSLFLGLLFLTVSNLIAQNAPHIISGKNVNVYLEEAEFGLPTPYIAYNPQTRQLELSDQVPDRTVYGTQNGLKKTNQNSLRPATRDVSNEMKRPTRPSSVYPVQTTQESRQDSPDSPVLNPIRQVSGSSTLNIPKYPNVLAGFVQSQQTPVLSEMTAETMLQASQRQTTPNQPAQSQASQLQTTPNQPAQFQASQLQTTPNQAAQFQASQLQMTPNQPAQFQASQLQTTPNQPAQVQASQLQIMPSQPAQVQASQLQTTQDTFGVLSEQSNPATSQEGSARNVVLGENPAPQNNQKVLYDSNPLSSQPTYVNFQTFTSATSADGAELAGYQPNQSSSVSLTFNQSEPAVQWSDFTPPASNARPAQPAVEENPVLLPIQKPVWGDVRPTNYTPSPLPAPVVPAYLSGTGTTTTESESTGLTAKQLDELIDSKASKLAWKKGSFSFTPYGYLNLAASWESQRTIPGDFCVYAQSPELTPTSDRSAFYIDPRSSRIGLKIDAPGPSCWTDSFARGVFECDFQGSYQVRNRSAFMLRKAYMEVGNKKTKFQFGQDWEIFAPLYPMMFNYTAGSGVGNLGYRRAMVRAEHLQDCSSDSSLLYQIGAGDNTLRDYLTPGQDDPRLTASGWPIIQGRLAYSFGKNTFTTGLPVVLGLSGQIGEQRGDYPGVVGDSFRTWAVCVDLDLPITKKLRLQGEAYTGENVSNLEGGIMQGVDLLSRVPIRSQGIWGAIQYTWTKKLKTNLGFLCEDPFDQDLYGTARIGATNEYTSRSYSECYFINSSYNWTDAFMTGLELSQWRTNWRTYNTGTNEFTYKTHGTPFRVELIARYTF
ncbi:MAG: hypothetical protein ACRC10_02970 [Thermoguttaceae bacterium]